MIPTKFELQDDYHPVYTAQGLWEYEYEFILLDDMCYKYSHKCGDVLVYTKEGTVLNLDL